MVTTDASRITHVTAFLLLSVADWFITYFRPSENAGNWLAAAFGAFVIRFIWPKIPLMASFWGWFVSFVISCLFAPDIMLNGGLWFIHRSEGVYAAVALVGDIIIQLAAWIRGLTQKVGAATMADPGAAFDSSLERVEKVTNVWLRIKAPFMDLLTTFSTFITKKP